MRCEEKKMLDLHREYQKGAAQHPGHVIAPVLVDGDGDVLAGIDAGLQHSQAAWVRILRHHHHQSELEIRQKLGQNHRITRSMS